MRKSFYIGAVLGCTILLLCEYFLYNELKLNSIAVIIFTIIFNLFASVIIGLASQGSIKLFKL